jgi:hypothetical protein
MIKINELCTPVILYIVFTLTQIIIDTFKGLYNTVFFKFIIMIGFTIALNFLCKRGLGIISWFIVFIPFITMTIISTLLLFTFGLSPSKGSINYDVENNNNNNNNNDNINAVHKIQNKLKPKTQNY